jgi:hypothetical protein
VGEGRLAEGATSGWGEARAINSAVGRSFISHWPGGVWEVTVTLAWIGVKH